MIAGAGTSVEAGLPSWAELASGLMDEVGTELRLAGEHLSRFREWSLLVDGLPGCGATAKAWLGDRLEPAMRRLLYRPVNDNPVPGPTAFEIARLQQAFGNGCEVVTTNYDTLFEQAMRASPLISQPVRSYTTKRSARDCVVVRHLHGILTPEQKRGRIVISEDDYHLMQDATRWQEVYCRTRLRSSTCLFLGTSLSDPNLLRYLYRAAGGPQHYAVFVRQGEDWSFDPEWVEVRPARERAARRRWETMNVTPLQADFFVQSAQFVHEVTLARSKKDDYVPYPKRLDGWEAAMRAGLLQRTDRTSFGRLQDSLSEVVGQWLTEVEALIDLLALRAKDEQFGVHLWVREPDRHALLRLASSTRSARDPRTVHSIPIQRPTSWVVVEAFCAGVPLNRTADNPHSRWNYIRAIPIILDDDIWGRLPVGIITLSSTTPDPDTALIKAPPTVADEISAYLARNAAQLLTP